MRYVIGSVLSCISFSVGVSLAFSMLGFNDAFVQARTFRTYSETTNESILAGVVTAVNESQRLFIISRPDPFAPSTTDMFVISASNLKASGKAGHVDHVDKTLVGKSVRVQVTNKEGQFEAVFIAPVTL